MPRARARRTLLLAFPISLIAIFTAYMIFAACAPLYMSNTMHTALPRKQGTVQGGFYLGTGIYNGNIAIAPVDGISLLGSYSYDPYELPKGDSTEGWGSHAGHRFWEVGLGHTFTIDSNRFELLAGYGAGTARAYWSFNSTPPGDTNYIGGLYRVDGDYQRIFLQMNGIRGEKYNPKDRTYAYQGIALRTSYLWFTRVDREDRSPTQPRAIFIDPVYFTVFGYRNIQAELRAGISLKVPLNDDELRYDWMFIQLGVRGLIDGLW